MQMPLDVGPLHFVGMGGIGMSAIAEILLDMGFQVQGSDMKAGANIDRLVDKGAKAFIGHDGENVSGAGVVVVSSAIKETNPEVIAARELNLPIVLRAEILAELMRFKSSIAVAGTHGKTTTTSLISALLVAGKLDPTVINGGIIEAFDSNARIGQGKWLVAEADESDGSFLKLPAEIGIITNIDAEHMEHYGSFKGLKASFKQFIEQLPFYGFALLGIDHAEVKKLADELKSEKSLLAKRVLTYGTSQSADIRLLNPDLGAGEVHFDIQLSDAMKGGAALLKDFRLMMPGHYNALNAAAAIGIAHELGVSYEDLQRGLAEFSGVKRRFTHVGSVNEIELYDDYAHHPVEISAVLSAAKSTTKGQVVAVMQPHRYSRLEHHFDDFKTCFQDADLVIMAPVYAAGEDPIAGFEHKDLGDALIGQGKSVVYIEKENDLAPIIRKKAQAGDLVIGLGAGSVSAWMYGLCEELVTAAA